ncbi:hypothetical protein CCM_02868 [Cordyceps militaris CM01]|uniref:Uncharacterized protein n=1 Tax=Cordyceps militaris (strain CM01) TaxID=983644 RepID=G3JCD6_CORMM|nr:uncharacterized protein CCM_02868 [Cordyceps militaris CM01]EGX94597.1 hypothetical protein CCM_02868 [Cordyceps militaris CM01]
MSCIFIHSLASSRAWQCHVSATGAGDASHVLHGAVMPSVRLPTPARQGRPCAHHATGGKQPRRASHGIDLHAMLLVNHADEITGPPWRTTELGSPQSRIPVM